MAVLVRLVIVDCYFNPGCLGVLRLTLVVVSMFVAVIKCDRDHLPQFISIRSKETVKIWRSGKNVITERQKNIQISIELA